MSEQGTWEPDGHGSLAENVRACESIGCPLWPCREAKASTEAPSVTLQPKPWLEGKHRDTDLQHRQIEHDRLLTELPRNLRRGRQRAVKDFCADCSGCLPGENRATVREGKRHAQ